MSKRTKKIILISIGTVVILLVSAWLILNSQLSDPVVNINKVIPSKLGIDPSDFKKEKMNPKKIESWEDGLRTSMKPGTYEWWYFDGHLTDGSKVVVVYFTKNYIMPQTEAEPHVSINITSPTGKEYDYQSKIFPLNGGASFSKKGCDVKIGENFCKGDLTEYKIFAKIKGLEVNLKLKRTVPSWRPGNGYLYFGKEYEKYFAWLPSVPEGDISGSMIYGGKKHSVKGTGYHDHNWGNTSVSKLLKKWWWARAKAGEYTIIAVEMISRNIFGSKKYPIFMVSKGDRIVADGALPGAEVSTIKADISTHPDPKRDKKIAQKLKYQYTLKREKVNIVFYAKDMIASVNLLDTAKVYGFSRMLVKSFGKKPRYTRFFSTVDFKIRNGDGEKSVKGISVLEKMDFE